MSWTIYGLRLKGDREARYIGLTAHTAASRLRKLTQEAKMYGRRPAEGFGGWLLDHENNIDAFDIAVAETKEAAHVAERETVRLCLALDHRLFNSWLVPAERRKVAA